jgi:hypothetical protein
VLVLVVPKDENAYKREVGLALNAIMLMSNVLSQDARLDIDV